MASIGLRGGLLGLGAAILLAACGGGGTGGTGGEPARVEGLVVVDGDVARRDPAALGVAPEEWRDGSTPSDTAALAHADWSVTDAGIRGVTAGDGTFEIEGLPPGPHVLTLERTLGGDLVSASLPFGVGSDGGASVLGEISWGRARVTSHYVVGGRAVEQIVSPSSASVVIENGHIVELGDGIRVWRDDDRDGDFDTCTVTRDVATCPVVQIDALAMQAPETIRVGTSSFAQAWLTLDDGSAIDVTTVATWQSSNASAATLDAFGRIDARGPGDTQLGARLGELASPTATLHVVARAALVRVQVQNASCYYPAGVREGDGGLQPGPLPPRPSDGIWAPTCTQVIEIGGTLSFIAVGEYADGDFQDLTNEAVWSVDPPAVAEITAGNFVAREAGTGRVVARVGEIRSEPTDVRVVAEPTLIALSVYAEDGSAGIPVIVEDGAAPPTDASLPCPGCGGFQLTVLRGDTVALHANGQYDTGAYRDLTSQVAWESDAPAVAAVGSDGTLTAVAGGTAQITARLGGLASAPAQIQVIEEATLQFLWVQPLGERVVARGDQREFVATGSYDVGFSRDVSRQVTWHSSDASLARFDGAGVLTAVAAGNVEVWAELDGIASEHQRLEVFETSELDYCDAAHVNRGTWSDGFNRVLLESDCATYSSPDVAALRFTVTETSSPGGIFDPCLDLYVYQGKERIRTIREEGCGEAFVPAPDAGGNDVLKYQLRAFWDLKDEHGLPVAPGTYQIHGRFYLYYDPVVSLTVTIE